MSKLLRLLVWVRNVCKPKVETVAKKAVRIPVVQDHRADMIGGYFNDPMGR